MRHFLLIMPLCSLHSQKQLPIFCWHDCSNSLCAPVYECYTYERMCGGVGQFCLKSDDVELSIYKDDGCDDDCDGYDDGDWAHTKKWTVGWICACSCTYTYYTLAFGSNSTIRGCCTFCFLLWCLFLIPFILVDVLLFIIIVICFPIIFIVGCCLLCVWQEM